MSFTPGWNDPPTGLGYQVGADSSSTARSLLTRRAPLPGEKEGALASPLPTPHPINAPVAPPAVSIFLPAGVSPVTAPVSVNYLEDNCVTPQFTDDHLISNLSSAALSATSSVTLDGNLVKRLDKLKLQLAESKVSNICRQKLCRLVHCINIGEFDQAYHIQARMMVDHQAEVKDWLSGPKNIIILCQKQTKAS